MDNPQSTFNDENQNVINNKVNPRIEYTQIKTLTDFNIGNKFTNSESKFSLDYMKNLMKDLKFVIIM